MHVFIVTTLDILLETVFIERLEFLRDYINGFLRNICLLLASKDLNSNGYQHKFLKCFAE